MRTSILLEKVEKKKKDFWLPDLLDQDLNHLVSQVGSAIKWSPAKALAFSVALLEDVNQHDDAAKANRAFLKSKWAQFRTPDEKKLAAQGESVTEARGKKNDPVSAMFYKYFDRIQVPLFDIAKIYKEIEGAMADAEDSDGGVDIDSEMKKIVQKWRR